MKARLIREGFFMNEDLAQCPFETRLLFQGLWCLADREGKLEDRPRRICVSVFPYDQNLDIDSMLLDLHTKGFILRYEAEQMKCILIKNFLKYQTIHQNEAKSILPNPEGYKLPILIDDIKAKPQVFKSAIERRYEREAETFRLAAENDLKRDKVKKLN